MSSTPEPVSEAVSDAVTGPVYKLPQAPPPLQASDEDGGVVSGPLPAPMTSATSAARSGWRLVAQGVPQLEQMLWNMNTITRRSSPPDVT
jgi:hypothetical protein